MEKYNKRQRDGGSERNVICMCESLTADGLNHLGFLWLSSDADSQSGLKEHSKWQQFAAWKSKVIHLLTTDNLKEHKLSSKDSFCGRNVNYHNN